MLDFQGVPICKPVNKRQPVSDRLWQIMQFHCLKPKDGPLWQTVLCCQWTLLFDWLSCWHFVPNCWQKFHVLPLAISADRSSREMFILMHLSFSCQNKFSVRILLEPGAPVTSLSKLTTCQTPVKIDLLSKFCPFLALLSKFCPFLALLSKSCQNWSVVKVQWKSTLDRKLSK